MKKSIISVLGVLLVLSLLLSSVGCSSEDDLWSAKYDGETLPIGVYIYYLATATNDAKGLVEDSEKSVLKQTVEDQDAEDWIREKAEYYISYYFAGQKLVKEKGITLTEEDLQNAESAASSYWAQMSDTMTDYGVAYESFKKVITLSYQLDRVFRSIYLEGGEKEVSDDEVTTYFEDNYVNYSYGLSYMYYYDENESYNLLSEDEQAEVEEAIQKQLDRFNNGEIDKEELEKELADEKYHTSMDLSDTENTFTFNDTVNKIDETSDISNAVAELEVGKAGL